MSCQKELAWYELIPIFSFLAFWGRCKNCKNKISLQYPLVEFVAGLIFALLFLKLQNIFSLDTIIFSFTYVYYAVAFSFLIVIAVYDFRHKIIPDTLSFIFGFLALVGLFFIQTNGPLNFSPHWPTFWEFFSGPIIAAPFAFFWLVSSGKWMGLGDAKLAIGLGWLLGLSLVVSGVVFAFWIGSIAGLSLVIFSGKKHGMKSEIPFAPYLVFGTLLAFLFDIYLF